MVTFLKLNLGLLDPGYDSVNQIAHAAYLCWQQLDNPLSLG